MEWFIVAIVYIIGQKEPQWATMDMAFQTKELCQKYYQTNLAVRDDVLKLYPNQRSHTLTCMNIKTINELKGTAI